MPRTNSDILFDIIRREGGEYTDHPADRGGPTKYGITISTLSNYRGYKVTPEEVAALTEPEARDIYMKVYLTDTNFHRIDNGDLRALVVDCGVNHGVKTAAKWLQRALRVKEDGIVGDQTLLALSRVSPFPLYFQILRYRLAFYAMIVAGDPSQAVFLRGWIARASEFLAPEVFPI